jgi:hypothetical protein
MARIELSKYLPDNIVKIIQNKLLPRHSNNLSFLYDIPNIYNYSTCLICSKIRSIVSEKILMCLHSVSTRELLITRCNKHYYCYYCYPEMLRTFYQKPIILN